MHKPLECCGCIIQAQIEEHNTQRVQSAFEMQFYAHEPLAIRT